MQEEKRRKTERRIVLQVQGLSVTFFFHKHRERERERERERDRVTGHLSIPKI